MYVKEFFQLNDQACDELHEMTPEFGYDGFGEVVFYRTYSRKKPDGGQESWADVVIRVINGVMSIRKDWYIKNHIAWREEYWQEFAQGMAVSLFKLQWAPPGRGLWAMGTSFVFERGSMSLYNCAFCKLHGYRLADDIAWLMDSLMLGVGVGFEPLRDNINIRQPKGSFTYIIQDTKEDWVHSVRLLILSYLDGTEKPIFDYSVIRGPNFPIRGFGGLSSGPEPLRQLHINISGYFDRYLNGAIRVTVGTGDVRRLYDVVRLKTDIANAVGVCVVAGNVRRSAEIAIGDINDTVFMDLKDYEKNPERASIGWMSNNSVRLVETEDFDLLGEVAKRVPIRGEPGILNLKNFKHGRIGKKDVTREDKADGLNPCGEIPLEDREVCNLAITCPTRCTPNEWNFACWYATFYSSTVSLLPTHQPSTNAVVARNRRIGVDIIDGALWMETAGLHNVIKQLRKGYKTVRRANQTFNAEAGVPEAIKVTTIEFCGLAA